MISIVDKKEHTHEPIVDKCVGCDRVIAVENVCGTFLYPAAKWRPSPGRLDGFCPMATHVSLETAEAAKKRVGQQKQGKKGKKKK